jgi:predicted outer membrane repeat protein
MKEREQILTMFFAALMIMSTATGQIITVDDDGPADFNNIQAAIDYSKEGDTIIVAEGKYVENINFLGKNITLTSIKPINPNIVDGTIINGKVTFRGTEGPSCTLTGFNIDYRIVGFDRLIDPNGENHTKATISYCILENFLTPCDAAIRACDGTISNCLIANIYPGCLVPWRVPQIKGCHGLIKNCTIADIPGGIEVMEGGTCTIENSILYRRVWVFVNSGATLNISYCDLEGGLKEIEGGGTVNWGAGNIDADPCFVRFGGLQDKGDYHLLRASSCIEAGDPGYLPGPDETDLDGNPRIVIGTIDMGVYEFHDIHTLYVDADAPAGGDGGDWATAFRHLQDALFNAMPPAEIRVAHGIYKPHLNTYNTPPPSRADTFQLKNRVTIKGGYAGPGEPDPDVRDVDLYETILSGDIGGNDVEVSDLRKLLDEPTRAENSYHVITASGTDSTAVLDGFTIIGGNANPGSAQAYSELTNMELIPPLPFDSRKWGGGLYNHRGSPTLIACTFFNNSSQHGGAGMYNRANSSPMLINCQFTGNSAGWNGGGIRNSGNSNPTLIECTFIRNSASGGGGMGNEDSNPTLVNCTFFGGSARNEGGGVYNYHSSPTLTNCTFRQNAAGWSGGAMGNNSFCSPVLIDCTFSGNSASKDGGGIYSNNGNSITLTRCTLTGNLAGELGGGIYNYSGEANLSNCIVSENSATWGGGIYNDSYNASTLANCTITKNLTDGGGGGICSRGANTSVTNCILWDDTSDEGHEIALFTYKFCYSEVCSFRPSLFTVGYSDIQGGPDGVYIDPNSTLSWGTYNIDADPLFVEQGYWDANGIWIDGDYHLLAGSPCIDAGDPNHPYGPNETDLDGKPRVMGGRIDMGAYEYSPPISAEVRILPRTINLQSKGKWIAASIQPPEGYGAADIDANSILLENEIEPEQFRLSEDQQAAIARFNKSEVQGIIDTGEVELIITGRLKDGITFKGTDVIRVIARGRVKK